MINYTLEKYHPFAYQTVCVGSEGGLLPINVYLPTVENDYNGTAIVCIHGGAWLSDLKSGEEWTGSWMKHNAAIFASLGYIAIEITYRSITETGINGIISDVEAAFRHISTEIKTRHGIKKLYAIGDSAGGHLALMSAIFKDETLRPEKVVACNPVSDLTDPKWQLYSTTNEERKNASPLFFTEKTDTEILILHGDADRTVPLSCSETLNEHFCSLGCNCSLETLNGASHAFILYGYKTPIEQVNGYMDRVAEFFN